MPSKLDILREKFDALLLREIAVWGGIPTHGGRTGKEVTELREAIAEVLETLTTPGPQTTVLRYMVDPYATGKFKLVDLELPTPLHDELLRVAADKGISIYYLAAIFHEGRHAAASEIVRSPTLPPCVNGTCLYSCADDECKKAVEKGIPWPPEPERKCARPGCHLPESEHGLQVDHFFQRRENPHGS